MVEPLSTKSVFALKMVIQEIVGLPVGAPTVRALSVTGESYVTLVVGGVKTEGDKFPALINTKSEAITAYLNSVRIYARGRKGVLYWRHSPELHEENGKFTIYSRLLISERSPIQLLSTPLAGNEYRAVN